MSEYSCIFGRKPNSLTWLVGGCRSPMTGSAHQSKEEWSRHPSRFCSTSRDRPGQIEPQSHLPEQKTERVDSASPVPNWLVQLITDHRDPLKMLSEVPHHSTVNQLLIFWIQMKTLLNYRAHDKEKLNTYLCLYSEKVFYFRNVVVKRRTNGVLVRPYSSCPIQPITSKKSPKISYFINISTKGEDSHWNTRHHWRKKTLPLPKSLV